MTLDYRKPQDTQKRVARLLTLCRKSLLDSLEEVNIASVMRNPADPLLNLLILLDSPQDSTTLCLEARFRV